MAVIGEIHLAAAFVALSREPRLNGSSASVSSQSQSCRSVSADVVERVLQGIQGEVDRSIVMGRAQEP